MHFTALLVLGKSKGTKAAQWVLELTVFRWRAAVAEQWQQLLWQVGSTGGGSTATPVLVTPWIPPTRPTPVLEVAHGKPLATGYILDLVYSIHSSF